MELPKLSTSKQTLPPDAGYELRNSEVSLRIALAEGARIASLRSVRSGLEFLTQARVGRKAVVPGLATPFQAGPCAGIEECLPTVGACGAETPGGPAPDHGDFWQLPWSLVEADQRRLVAEADGFSRPFRFRKEIAVQGASVRVRYTLENRGTEALPFLYACHPLFAVDPGDRIVLPPEVEALALYYSRGERMGPRGTTVRWPETADGERLDRTGGPNDGVAEMFYTGRLNGEATCSIVRDATGERIEIRFSAGTLPFLGVWLCYGGWPDEGAEPLQYAVALEPTTSPCNTLAEAVADGSAPLLEGGATTSWEIAFVVSGRV